MNSRVIKQHQSPGSPGTAAVQQQQFTLNFDPGLLERYIESTGDTTPIYYLIERYLRDKPQVSPAAVAQLVDLVAQMQPLLRQVGAA
jgi:hypothetical protein